MLLLSFVSTVIKNVNTNEEKIGSTGRRQGWGGRGGRGRRHRYNEMLQLPVRTPLFCTLFYGADCCLTVSCRTAKRHETHFSRQQNRTTVHRTMLTLKTMHFTAPYNSKHDKHRAVTIYCYLIRKGNVKRPGGLQHQVVRYPVCCRRGAMRFMIGFYRIPPHGLL